MALHIEGKKSNIRKKDFVAFAERFKISKKEISDDYLLVDMIPKPEELEEVVITNLKLAPWVTQKDLDQILENLRTAPMKVLGWKTPQQVFEEEFLNTG